MLCVRTAELNRFGYEVMLTGHVTDPVGLFKLNVEEHPDSFNVYDSLAESCARAGQAELAKTNYAKSLA